MPHKPEPERNLSMKTKLFLIVIMFVIINLIFYVGFDSSDESDNLAELNDKNQLNVEENMELEKEIVNSIP